VVDASRRLDVHGSDLRHAQVLRRLETDILTGRLVRGERLAAERDLGARLGVARNTLRKALMDLESRGLIESQGRRGWVVTASFTERVEGPQGLTDWARRHGFVVTSRVRTSRLRPASDDEAMRLRLVTGSPVFELERIRLIDGLPLSLDRSALRPDLADHLAGVDFSTTSLYTTLQERAGIVPMRADVVIRAINADARLARLLGTRRCDALLELTETAVDQYGDPFEAATLINRGDRYAFGTTLGSQGRSMIELDRSDR
jgi:GntR family transcriptional regulator